MRGVLKILERFPSKTLLVPEGAKLIRRSELRHPGAVTLNHFCYTTSSRLGHHPFGLNTSNFNFFDTKAILFSCQ
jgi:hypothetical protein